MVALRIQFLINYDISYFRDLCMPLSEENFKSIHRALLFFKHIKVRYEVWHVWVVCL
jgi:hypothetical protein